MAEAGFARSNGHCIRKAQRERSVSAESAGNTPLYSEESREGGLIVEEKIDGNVRMIVLRLGSEDRNPRNA